MFPISPRMQSRSLVACCALLGATIFWPSTVVASEAAATDAEPLLVAPPMYRSLKVSVGFHYSSGDYESSDNTEIFYVPLLIRAELSRVTLLATIPYIRIDGPPGIIDGPAGPVETNGKGDGLGDLFLRGSYLLPLPATWPLWVPFIDLAGVVKFPTASRNDGLGTGEFDFGIESDLNWQLGRLTPFVTLGYRFLGDPPDANLHNVFGALVGAQYRILDPVAAGLFLDFREASSSATDERLELIPFVSWEFAPSWSFESYVSAGLADGSPDVGMGVQLGRSW